MTKTFECQQQRVMEVIDVFCASMYRENEENAHKGILGEDATVEALFSDLHYHLAKWTMALSTGDRVALREYAADVANYLLFIGNKMGCYSPDFSPLPRGYRVILNKEGMFEINSDPPEVREHF